MNEIFNLLLGVIGGGGLTTLIIALLNKKKTSAETGSVIIKDALSIENIAIERYKIVADKLLECERLLEDIRKDVDIYTKHIDVLHKLLDKHGIKYPDLKLKEI